MIAAIAYGLLAAVAAFCGAEAFRPAQPADYDEAVAFGASLVGAVAVGALVGLAVGGVG